MTIRRSVAFLLTIALTLGLTGLVSAPAQAAKPAVTIKKIATQTVGYSDTTTVKPRVSKKGAVTFRSKTLTVTKSGKRVATAKRSVTLKTGTYRVTTVAKYRVKKKGKYGKTKTKKLTQTLKVTKPKACATKSDYNKVKTVDMYYDGKVSASQVDDMISTAKDLRSKGRSEGAATLGELFDYAYAVGDYEVADAFAYFAEDEGYGWDAIMEIRSYTLCKSKKRAEVTYIDVDAWFKEIV